MNKLPLMSTRSYDSSLTTIGDCYVCDSGLNEYGCKCYDFEISSVDDLLGVFTQQVCKLAACPP